MLSATIVCNRAKYKKENWVGPYFIKKGCEDFRAGGCCNAILLFEAYVLKIFFGPSYHLSRASLLCFAMCGTAFFIEWLSPSHYLYIMLLTMAGYQLSVCVCRVM